MEGPVALEKDVCMLSPTLAMIWNVQLPHLAGSSQWPALLRR